MTQHANVTTERWAHFSLQQQILMIANEMHRASKKIGADELRQNSYERVLRLVDLTVQVQNRYTLRKELLRWRDLIAQMYVDAKPDPPSHLAALRSLLLMTPESARQIPFVCG